MKERKKSLSPAFSAYEAGKAYKRKIGLYESVRKNERFYRGEQWYGCHTENLPKPVFNLIRRVTDYMVASVARAEFSIRYTDETLYYREEEEQKTLRLALRALSGQAERLWKSGKLEGKVHAALLDAALSGDGVFYCHWDPDKETGQAYSGDIETEVIDSTSLFLADVNTSDIQSQAYILLSGREDAAALRREAIAFGVSPSEAAKILPDAADAADPFTGDPEVPGDLAAYELTDENGESGKTTFLLRFWKENGEVWFEKSTRSCVIRRAGTGCHLYPIAYFHWSPTKGSCHGTSPITGMIPNQKFINRAFAMVMKHMQDTAFSKVIYDKSKIPEWTNEIGEAIAAVGGGSISDAVEVVGVGQMQTGFADFIDATIQNTKEMLGATETALGDAEATNTSAILALQESSQLPLRQVRGALMQCLSELGEIWADMISAYYPKERRVIVPSENGEARLGRAFDFGILKKEILSAAVDVREVNRYSAAAAQSVLDRLLEGGHITPSEYLKRLPNGVIPDRDALIQVLEENRTIKPAKGVLE